MCYFIFLRKSKYDPLLFTCIFSTKGEIKSVNMSRLVLCEVTANVLERCFHLLGLKTIEKMWSQLILLEEKYTTGFVSRLPKLTYELNKMPIKLNNIYTVCVLRLFFLGFYSNWLVLSRNLYITSAKAIREWVMKRGMRERECETDSVDQEQTETRQSQTLCKIFYL